MSTIIKGRQQLIIAESNSAEVLELETKVTLKQRTRYAAGRFLIVPRASQSKG